MSKIPNGDRIVTFNALNDVITKLDLVDGPIAFEMLKALLALLESKNILSGTEIVTIIERLPR